MHKKEQKSIISWRPDIDGLRALAVFAVFAFHAFPKIKFLKGGFVGVDIFFVISGFLISSIIFSQLEKGTFSFWDFYSRRIRRIYPVLLTVLIACLGFGWFYLLADEYMQLGKHIAGGAGFISNFVLFFEKGYFDNDSATKPLLHLWSLGIEEQFYIFWPLIFWLSWKKKLNGFTVALVIAIISMWMNIHWYKTKPEMDFFLPHTRVWELLCGAMLAWGNLHWKEKLEPMRMKAGGWIKKAIFFTKRAEPLPINGIIPPEYSWTLSEQYPVRLGISASVGIHHGH
ncbi:MAG: acyltransferase family protein [Oxalobacter sp.]